MSDVMEKAVAALPGLLSDSFGVASDRDWGYSRNFQIFIKHVSSIKNKSEEDAFLERELSLQKQKLAQPNQSPLQIRESLVRIVYCHMLGKDVSFACIHAVKLAQQGSILDKKVGYLVCSLLMNKDHELVMLLINTMQKDLSSSNVLCNLAGLTAVIHLCSTEMVPAMLPLVKEKLSHPKDAVRKKGVIAMLRFLQLAPEMIQHEVACLQLSLADKDPSVVWAALHVFSELVPKAPSTYQYLVPSLISILGQIVGRNLSTDYDYHTVPAPWMTIVLLRLLGTLGAHDESASQQIYPALKDVLQKTEPSHKMGLAVIFECLQTITRIYPHPSLADHAVSCVGKFLTAKNINLKYLGLKALVSMVTISPQCTVEHQEVVLDCLEHSDPTIQRMTLQLLYKMAGSSNVKVISDKMLEFMCTTSDHVIRSDIVHKVIDLTESTDLLSYLNTMNQVIQAAENFIPNETTQTVLWKIFQGCISSCDESDPLGNKQMRAAVLQLYFQLLQKPNLPEILIEISAWVLGEYNHCVQDITPKQVITTLLQCFTQSKCDKTQCQIVGALQKMAYYITDLSAVMAVLKTTDVGIGSSYYYELKQRIQEFELLCRCKQDLKIAANPETRIHAEQMDLTLTFLDQFVCDALEHGAAPYNPQLLQRVSLREVGASTSSGIANLNFTPYEMPPTTSKSSLYAESVTVTTSGDSNVTSSRDKTETSLKLKAKKKVWTKEGIVNREPKDVPHQNEQQTQKTDSDTVQVQEPKQEKEVKEMTPEQLKRKKLAEAIFSEIKPNIKENTQGNTLISLSTYNTAEDVESVSIQGSTTENQPRHSSVIGTLHSSNVYGNEQSNFTTPESKNSLSRLLDNDTVTSPEDQTLSGSLCTSIDLNQSQAVHRHDKITSSETQISKGSMDTSLMRLPDSNTIATDLAVESSVVRVKDMHPSPWKLVGHCKQNETCIESGEDSISIEVDSIEEDEPPSEFNVEGDNVANSLRKHSNPVPFNDVLVLKETDLISVKGRQLLLQTPDLVCYYQKELDPDCLVLLLEFKPKLADKAASMDILGLLIQQSHYDVTVKLDPDRAIDTKQLISFDLPTTFSIHLKGVATPPLEPFQITLKLSGDVCDKHMKFDFNLTDFLRPLCLDIEHFAEAWTAENKEFRRTSITTKCRRDHSKVIEKLGFKMIQEKGSEVIFAAHWLSVIPEVILVHTKCTSNAVQVSVKGQQVLLVDAVIAYIQDSLLVIHNCDLAECAAAQSTAGQTEATAGQHQVTAVQNDVTACEVKVTAGQDEVTSRQNEDMSTQ